MICFGGVSRPSVLLGRICLVSSPAALDDRGMGVYEYSTGRACGGLCERPSLFFEGAQNLVGIF